MIGTVHNPRNDINEQRFLWRDACCFTQVDYLLHTFKMGSGQNVIFFSVAKHLNIIIIFSSIHFLVHELYDEKNASNIPQAFVMRWSGRFLQ